MHNTSVFLEILYLFLQVSDFLLDERQMEYSRVVAVEWPPGAASPTIRHYPNVMADPRA
jgi:hypothetical protein